MACLPIYFLIPTTPACLAIYYPSPESHPTACPLLISTMPDIELPDPEEKEGGMEAVRRRAIIHAERDALARRHAG